MLKVKRGLFLVLLIFMLLSLGSQIGLAQNRVRLMEVVHSIFYAPQYVALNEGFFAEQGLEVELSTAWGGDKAAASLMADNCDIALIGPEPSIYVYQQGAKNYLVNFAQLTNTAGSFLLARQPMPDFQWEDVKNKTIIGNRPGGAPQMVLEYVLKSRNIIPGKDVEVITNLDFTANAGAFLGGLGDFVQLFEPAASTLEAEGKAYVVASFGEAGGSLPYTVYMAKLNYIQEHPELVLAFTRAIYQAQLWVAEHSAEEIAKSIQNFFPDTDPELLVKVVARYKEQGSWDKNPLIEKEVFESYEDIIILAGELQEKIPYEAVVNTEFAEKVMAEEQK